MENFKIDLTKNQKSSDFSIMGKIHDYHEMIREHEKRGLNVLLKSPMTSANAREVVVKERNSGKEIKTLMFGSNNYLGAITHPYVIAKTLEAIYPRARKLLTIFGSMPEATFILPHFHQVYAPLRLPPLK